MSADRSVPPSRDPSRRPRVGLATVGLWRRRVEIAEVLDADPVLSWPVSLGGVDLLAGWGHKSTAARQRLVARLRGLPYVALEDGFLRSVRPGRTVPSIGWIVDRSGIYYDASGPSDLEAATLARASVSDPEARADAARMEAALGEIRRLRLSKYNHAPMRTAAELGLPAGRDVVVVFDQTAGDASIAGAGAEATTFAAMLEAAIAENPGRTVVVKVHPEAISGAKRGHLAARGARDGVVVVAEDVNPWALIEIAVRVYVVSSQIGLEAMLAGVPVTCFGAAAYAGWGLTDDRFAAPSRRTARPTRQAFAAAAYLDYCRWIDPWRKRAIDFESAIDRLGFLSARHHAGRPTVCLGFSRWKRRSVSGFLDGVAGPPVFAQTAEEAVATARDRGARLLIWGSRPLPAAAEGRGAPAVVRVEDGFLRSVGLGASFVSPASLVFDDRGIYYDPTRESGFEAIVATAAFEPELVARAARLRAEIVARGLSKYNESEVRALDLPAGRRRVLVPGQVEDDASVRLGSPVVTTNLELLTRARARNPDAVVVYKPHPDVQAGYRKGAIDPQVAARLADLVVTDVSMASLLGGVDAVETMTSLTGFEALIRGLAVVTHGAPFYSGWGLTEDLLPVDRRRRRLTLDELVAATLILYPAYVDPRTGQPCPVEVIVDRLSEGLAETATARGRVRRLLRHAVAWSAHNVTGPVWRRLRR